MTERLFDGRTAERLQAGRFPAERFLAAPAARDLPSGRLGVFALPGQGRRHRAAAGTAYPATRRHPAPAAASPTAR
jgi:hypothetical protein